MENNYFYALSSADALGVFTDYNAAFSRSRGLRKNRIKKFSSYKEAYDYARDGFDEHQDDVRYMTFHGLELGLNRLVFRPEIRRARNEW